MRIKFLLVLNYKQKTLLLSDSGRLHVHSLPIAKTIKVRKNWIDFINDYGTLFRIDQFTSNFFLKMKKFNDSLATKVYIRKTTPPFVFCVKDNSNSWKG